MGEGIIELQKASVGYTGERVATLFDVTLTARAGEMIVIVGPNGAGKTTLLEAVNGILPLTAGEVRVFGQRMTAARHDLRRDIAYLPQELFFPPETPFLTRDVVHAARFGLLRPFRFPREHDCQLVNRALAAVGMQGAASRPVGRLSGGQQRKVLLARALAQRARLLLLDEPTVNLDPQAKADVCRLVLEVRKELGAAALVVTHEADLLLEEADRVITLVQGRLESDEERPPLPRHARVGGR